MTKRREPISNQCPKETTRLIGGPSSQMTEQELGSVFMNGSKFRCGYIWEMESDGLAVTFLQWILGHGGVFMSQLWRFRIINLYSKMFLCLSDGGVILFTE